MPQDDVRADETLEGSVELSSGFLRMATNHETPTEYELAVKAVYEAILNQGNAENSEVKHNQKLVGKSGVAHQIDVLWRFRQAGVEHLVLIECKNYGGTVELGDVREFHSVVDDITGARGVMVTRVGFQSGAVDYAKYHGIGLKLLRAPEEQDWAGYIKGVNVYIIFKSFDHRKPLNVSLGVAREYGSQVSNARPKGNGVDIQLRDKNGNAKTPPLGLWLSQQVPIRDKAAGGPYKHKIELPDTYAEFERDNGESFLVRVDTIDVEYHVSEDNREVRVDAGQLVKYVLKDFLSGEVERFQR